MPPTIRRNFRLILSIALIPGILCLAVTPVPAAEKKTPVEKNETILRVGISANAAPIAYKQGETIVGLEPELAAGLSKHLGKQLELIELAWKDQIPALLEDRTDIIMSGMTITKMRRVRIAFTDPYLRTGQMALIRKVERRNFPVGFFAIQGMAPVMNIGVVDGTTGAAFVNNHFRSAREIRGYKSSRSAINDLVVGRINILIHDGPIIMMLAAENEGRGIMALPDVMTDEYLGWGIRKNDVDLLNDANAYVAEIKSNGTLRNIVNRRIPLAE